jgi:hypothetical protein
MAIACNLSGMNFVLWKDASDGNMTLHSEHIQSLFFLIDAPNEAKYLQIDC